MHIPIGALVLDAPIFTYAPLIGVAEVEEVDGVLLEARVATDYGVIPVLIDVVTEKGFQAWLETIKEVAGALQKNLELNKDTAQRLAGHGRRQHENFRRDLRPGA